MDFESRLQLEAAPAPGNRVWREWWQSATRGWLAHRASSRRVATARVRLGFERIPPRVWARHGALLTAAKRLPRH
ncbi:hypothetical protein BJI67_12580 [Acidihalobacter aeolianus]|uniref:Uncharacterized protein n=1 Tax=Acidihalobacter aeolianus TaxID=2792603 RepID=A0A1D8K9Y6_9GAMM|nr:hypothetical protein [Acidihalobacter aeolianus]AOV17772.1 hypothetical protein BJI67_12580 [Acidihalobacter aeolianus]